MAVRTGDAGGRFPPAQRLDDAGRVLPRTPRRAGLPGGDEDVPADPFLFASNYPYCPLDEVVQRYHGFGLSDDVLTKVLHDNAKRLLFPDSGDTAR
ncbi:amidohydrolase family protein [Streptomyces sp. NPDC018338]|uniref:amidohydrolase family protein n=1 Tax=Streptomyces sp. NPDC018338 TaxID=3157192 RepID=UPI0033E788E7